MLDELRDLSYSGAMKVKKEVSDKVNMEGEGLYQQYMGLKPQFGSKAEARLQYLREMEAIASRYNSTIENLVTFIDKKNTWSEEDRHFMRLVRLASSLR
jgi:hypothetical protein